MSTEISAREQYWINQIRQNYPQFNDVPIRINEYTISVLDAVGIENLNLFVEKGYFDTRYDFKASRSYEGEAFDGAVTLRVSADVGVHVGKESGSDIYQGVPVSVGYREFELEYDILTVGDPGAFNPQINIRIADSEFGQIDQDIQVQATVDGFVGQFEVGDEFFTFRVDGTILQNSDGAYYFYKETGVEGRANISVFNNIAAEVSSVSSPETYLFGLPVDDFRDSSFQGPDGLGGKLVNSYATVVFDLITGEYAEYISGFDLSYEDFKLVFAREVYQSVDLDDPRTMGRVLTELFDPDSNWFQEHSPPSIFDPFAWTPSNGSDTVGVPKSYYEQFFADLVDENSGNIVTHTIFNPYGNLFEGVSGYASLVEAIADIPERTEPTQIDIANDFSFDLSQLNLGFNLTEYVYETYDGILEKYILKPVDDFLNSLEILDLSSVINLPGNEWVSDSLITTVDTAASILLGPTNIFSLALNAGELIYEVFAGDQGVYHSQDDIVLSVADNLYLDFDTDFSQGIYDFSTDNSVVDFELGLAVDGGNYTATMNPNVLNGDGFFNTLPSSITVDSIHPGTFKLEDQTTLTNMDFASDTIYDFSQNLGDTLELVISSGVPSGGTITNSVSKFTSSVSGAQSLLNIDPLVLDLDGDGAELISYDASIATFDVDNDGYIEATGWVGGDDALLVHDLNSDGVINDITETISEYYGLSSGQEAIYLDGLDALKTLDSNDDGVFDANDTAYGDLRVWQDANEDARTDAGELKTLAEMGITSIDLTREVVEREELEGNPVLSRSTMTINGQTHEVVAVDFTTNAVGYEWNNITDGATIDLEDGSASTFIVSDQTGATIDFASLDVDAVIGGKGNDVITGDANSNWIFGGAGSDVLQGGAGDDLLIIDAEDDLANIDAGDGFDVVHVTGHSAVVLNLADINAEVAVGGDGNDTIISGSNTNVFVRGGNGDDVIIGGSADDALSGEDGDDFIDGGLGDDIIRGHRGDDRLIGNEGEDYLEGGRGDDELYGEEGEDLLKGGFGNDHLYGGDNYDVAEYSGKLEEYDVTVLGDGTIQVADRVEGRDGVDILQDVEALNFQNIKEVAIDLDNPITANDVLDITGSDPYTLTAAEILANDIDYQGDDLHITAVSNVQGGTAELVNGDVLFTPDENYHGVMSFKYSIADSHGNEGANAVLQTTGETAEIKGTVNLRTTDHPDDPLFYDQWYLSDANILPVWNDYTGKGVNVGVFEIGLMDVTHSDLVDNLSQETIDTATDDLIDGHATLVTGVIAAAKNDQGSVGVAYDATVSGHAFGGDDLDLENLNNVVDNFQNYDIVNNSWGVTQPFLVSLEEGSPYQVAAANGRDGLGTVIVTAAGNERQSGDSANAHALYNNKFTISVGAINKNADLSSLEIQQDPFSNPGSNILISAPGSNITSTSILLENSNGSVFGNDFDTAQGTSFATPLVSGVVALMLEANPDLGYRDVMEILAYSARSVSDENTVWQTNGATTWNGGGLHFSHDYGFGNVDALAAVRLAETWTKQQTIHNEAIYENTGSLSNAAILDNGTALTDTITVSLSDPFTVEHATVTIDFTHSRVGDLVIKLISPNGTEGILLDRLGVDPGSSSDLGHGAESLTFDFGNVSAWGESVNGDWQLVVEDAVTGETGTINSWSLQLSGNYQDLDDVYIYTEEFSTLSDSSRLTLEDLNGGDDTINAATVGSNLTINLNAGSNSVIDGKTLTIASGTEIERAISGDGDDVLTGNSVNNLLFGGRGDDTISGGAGKDWLVGAWGDDDLTGGSGKDRFVVRYGDTGTNTITDFNESEDLIVLSDFEDVHDVSDLNISISGNDQVITLSDGQTIIIENTASVTLSNDHFDFLENFNLQDLVLSIDEFTLTDGDDFFLSPLDGQDTQIPDSTPQRIYGLGGNDTIGGNLGDDEIHGGDGDDILIGYYNSTDVGAGNDTLYGDAGDDALYGSGEADLLYGGTGNDVLFGNLGNDVLFGGEGYDNLIGNEGNDILYLEHGLNIAYGDSSSSINGAVGNDLFVVDKWTESVSGGVLVGFVKDLIRDFDINHDVLDLSQFYHITSLEDLGGTNLTIGEDQYTLFYLDDGEYNQNLALEGVDKTTLTADNFIFHANVAPEAFADSFTTTEDTPLSFSVQDLLDNDTDFEDGTPSFSKIVTDPEHGSLTDDGAGNYTYTPDENYYGADSFVYEVIDTKGESVTSLVNLNVTSVNDAPDVVDSTISLAEDASKTIHVLNTADDVDGDVLDVTISANPSNGVVVVNADKSITYTPDSNYNGADSFEYQISDGKGGISTATIDVTVNAVNDDPVAVDDAFTGDEDIQITGNVLTDDGIDSDADLDSLSVIAETITTAQGGTVEILANGDFTYTPLADFNGADSFEYTVEDGNGGSDTGTVSLTVNSINDAPVGTGDAVTTDEDTPIIVDVLNNDNDADLDSIEIQSVTDGTHGVVVINADETVTYTPDENWNGSDSFTYTVSDGNGGTDTVTVDVTVNAVNDAPSVNTSAGSVEEDSMLTFTSDMLDVADIDNAAGELLITLEVLPSNGVLYHDGVALSINDTVTHQDIIDGLVTFEPDENYNGTDSFDYSVFDGENTISGQSFALTVSAVNDAPVGTGDTVTTDEDTPIVIDVLNNDSDVDLDDLDVQSVTNGTHGTVVINPDDTVTYTPDENWNGSDSFTYTVSDGNGETDIVTVDVTVDAVNDNPVAADDAFTGDEDTQIIGNVLNDDGIDSDVDLDTLNVVAETITTAQGGTVVILANGDFTYTPVTDFYGSDSFEYTLEDGNGGSDTGTVSLTVNEVGGVNVITGTNSGDTLYGTSGVDEISGLNASDTLHGYEGDDIIYGGSGNDRLYGYEGDDILDGGAGNYDWAKYNVDVGGVIVDLVTGSATDGWGYHDTLIDIERVDGSAHDDVIYGDDNDNYLKGRAGNDHLVGGAGNDTIAGNGHDDIMEGGEGDDDINGGGGSADAAVFNGVYANYTVDVASGSGTVVDNVGSEGTDTLTNVEQLIFADGVWEDGVFTSSTTNSNPVAVDDAFSGNEDAPITGNVLTDDGIDSDIDLDSLSVVAETITTAQGGTVELLANGDFTYTPVADFNGADSFNYILEDGNGGSDTGTVSLTVNAINDAPVGTGDAVTTDEDTPIIIDVLSNDGDVDLDGLDVQSVTDGTHGSVVINPNDTVTYTPDENWNGSDSFTYTVSDGNGGTDIVTVDVTVNAVNDNPVAVDDAFTGDEDVQITGNVLIDDGIDSDVDLDTLNVVADTITTAQGGTVELLANGDFTYTSVADFNGADSFEYTLEDGNGGSDTGTVSLSVNAINDAPILTNNGANGDEDSIITLTQAMLDLADSDTSAENRIFTQQSQPSHGTLYLDGVALTIDASFTQQDLLDGLVTFEPDADFNGADSFDFVGSDGTTALDVETFNIAITAVNDAPVGTGDAVTTDEDTPIIIDVLNNDSDVDLDDLDIQSVTDGTRGSVAINPDDTVTYTPDENWNGSDSFTYTVSDGNGGTDTVTVDVTVNAMNDNPVAVDDAFTGTENTEITGNVLDDNGNGVDGDPDLNSLSVVAATITTVQGGTVELLVDGSFTYTPLADFVGSDSFDYTLEDGNGGSDIGAVSLTVDEFSYNYVTGTSSNEDLYGSTGADYIDGKNGNDNLYGYEGDDTYIWNIGDGNDVITDTSGMDHIELGAGITADDVRLLNEPYYGDLYLYIGDEQVRVSGHFNNTGNEVENILFSDGSTLALTGDLTFKGTSGNNLIRGQSNITANDTFIGLEGDDTLYGYDGDDTYYWNLGDGNDVIEDTAGMDLLVLGAGITVDDLRLENSLGGDLRLHIGSEYITVRNQFDATGYEVETILFDDDSTFNLTGDLTFTGSSSNDFVYAQENVTADDTLIGLEGNDYLYGYDGDDTYVWNIGDGNDIIRDDAGTADQLVLGAGITLNDLRFWNDYGDLQIHIGNEYIEVSSQYYNSLSPDQAIETILFDDGSTFDVTGTMTFTGTSETDMSIRGRSIETTTDILIGLEGDDRIYGGDGDDIYVWNMGDGNDIIYEGGGTADQIELGAGITTNDVRLWQDSNRTLYVHIGDEHIEVFRHFDDEYREVETLTFNDGATLDLLNNLTFVGHYASEHGYGSDNDDVIYGLGGHDRLYGRDGNDIIYGGDESNSLYGGDELYGGGGNDILYGGADEDELYGDDGDDTLHGGADDDIIYGGYGEDTVVVSGDFSEYTLTLRDTYYELSAVSGSEGTDELYNVEYIQFADQLYTLPNILPVAADDAFIGDQNTQITGNVLNDNGSGADSDTDLDDLSVVAGTITTDQGVTVELLADGSFTYTPLTDFSGSDSFDYTVEDGNGGSDSATVTFTIRDPAYNYLIGTASGNFLDGDSGDDYIDGRGGSDWISGYDGNDLLYGGDGYDYLYGGNGDDMLYGGADGDELTGYNGNDTLYGGDGFDYLYGGSGADTFVFEADSAFNDVDWIGDYNAVSGDAIDIVNLLTAYDSTQDDIDDFVTLTETGSSTVISVDRDGTDTTYTAQDVVNIDNVTGLDLDDMITNGELLVA
jgi:Ca2+-binding RTX toxin-like protein